MEQITKLKNDILFVLGVTSTNDPLRPTYKMMLKNIEEIEDHFIDDGK